MKALKSWLVPDIQHSTSFLACIPYFDGGYWTIQYFARNSGGSSNRCVTGGFIKFWQLLQSWYMTHAFVQIYSKSSDFYSQFNGAASRNDSLSYFKWFYNVDLSALDSSIWSYSWIWGINFYAVSSSVQYECSSLLVACDTLLCVPTTFSYLYLAKVTNDTIIEDDTCSFLAIDWHRFQCLTSWNYKLQAFHRYLLFGGDEGWTVFKRDPERTAQKCY